MKKKLTAPTDNNFGRVLSDEVKKKFKNQSIFAEKIGVTQATVSRYMTGKALPSFQILRKMSDILNVDLGIASQTEEHKINKENIVSVPFFYSEVSAGRGLEALDNAYETMYFDEGFLRNQFIIKNINDIFALKIKGDSMEPIISEGDIVFAKKYNNEPSSQGIYIVCYNNEYFIKKIQLKSKETIKLISANQDYDPIEVNLKDENTTFIILAKVIGRINIRNFANYSLNE